MNGVSKLHSDIIKKSVFKDFYDYTPEKFTNVTNGIAHRRWLNQSNPELCALLDDCIGEGYAKDAAKLADFKKYENDESVLKRLEELASLTEEETERMRRSAWEHWKHCCCSSALLPALFPAAAKKGGKGQ